MKLKDADVGIYEVLEHDDLRDDINWIIVSRNFKGGMKPSRRTFITDNPEFLIITFDEIRHGNCIVKKRG